MMANQTHSTYKNTKIDTVVYARGNVTVNKRYYYNTPTLSEPLTSSLPTLSETFVGREDQINELNKLIFEEQEKLVVVSGFSGFGKSELVKRFVSANKVQCNILWVIGETAETIKESFIGIFNIKNEDYNHTLVKSHCESLQKTTFIVFDNALSREEIRKYEVNTENVHYIITSNNQNWGRRIKILNLDVLTEQAALQIFKDIIGENMKIEDLEIYKKIAKLTGYVPLTLQVVASYLYQKNRALSELFILQNYLEQLEIPESNNFAIIEKLPDYSSEDYKKSFYLALKMTIDGIGNTNNKESELALTIINICAFLYSNKIYYIDFSNIPHFKKQVDKKEISENDIREACNLLRNYCLISINSDNKSFRIHDLVQKTLILHQNFSVIDKLNVYFYYNLETLLHINDTTQSHGNYILNPTLNMIDTFQQFVTEYYTQITKTPILCINLILANSKLYLNEIFNKMGKTYSKSYIDSNYLLHMSVESDHYDVFEVIINWGADVDLKYDCRTVLMEAARNIHFKIIKLLVNKSYQGINDENSIVLFYTLKGMQGIKNKHKSTEAVEILRFLVDKGADVTARSVVNMSLLHAAALTLNIEIMECLIHEYKLDVNILDKVGQTPIFYILHADDTDRKRRLIAARFLIDAGTDLKLKNISGKTAAEVARTYGIDYLYKYYTSTNPEQDLTDVDENPRADKLLKAVADGDLDAVRHLFNELGEQAAQFAESCEAPHKAIYYERKQILEFLLDHGVSVDSRGQNGITALHEAAIKIDFATIKYLVSRGADIIATDNDGLSVLSYLIVGLGGHLYNEDKAVNILKWLVEKGADPNNITNDKSTLVHEAARVNTSRLLRCLVHDYGLNVNAVNMNHTAIHNAILYKFVSRSEEHWWETVLCLLDLGARFDIKDEDGITSIEIARERNLPDVADMLEILQAVADGNLDVVRHLFEGLGENAAQLTQLCQLPHEAVRYRKYKILEYLLDQGIPVDSRGQQNRTCLHTAALNTDFKAIKILVERGSDITLIDINNWSVLSCLIFGVTNNYDKEVEACYILPWLVEKGADPQYVDTEKLTLVHAAARVSTARLLRCLVQDFGLKINIVDTEGTALHNAILYKELSDSEHHWWETIRCLLDLGARLDITDENGRTPVELARERNLVDAANIFELWQAVADGNLDVVCHWFELLGQQAAQLAQSCYVPHQAITQKKYQILEYFLDHGVPVDSRGKYSMTFLHAAALTTDFAAIKILVGRGCDLAATDTSNRSVLSYLIVGAASNYDKEDKACDILKWLVEKGADPKHVNNDKSTLVHVSVQVRTPRLLRCLVQDYGLDINALDTNGTALHTAVLYKNILYAEDHWWETVQCLLDLGAHLDITDKNGKTPIEVSREQNLLDVTNLFTTFEKKKYTKFPRLQDVFMFTMSGIFIYTYLRKRL